MPATAVFNRGETEHDAIGPDLRAAPVVAPDSPSRDAHQLFQQHAGTEAVVICAADNKPKSLLMRNKFYSRLGTLYGSSLYFEKPVMLLADEGALILEADTPLPELIDLALGREEERLYDAVVITDGGRFKGIVTVADLLKRSRIMQVEARGSQRRMAERTSGLLTAIEEDVKRVAAAARQGADSARSMRAATEQGRQQLDHAAEAFGNIWTHAGNQQREMDRLEQTAHSVTGISAVITELAGRCNLLALNATIEAARAGEAGRSFAVVANEIRQLADQTERSALQITGLIADIESAVAKAIAASGRGKEEAERTRPTVNAAKDLFGELSVAALQSGSVMDQINRFAAEAEARADGAMTELSRLMAELEKGKV
ncbi:methyl-accepting chemotaxis protein [Paenibacillus beijingensis]|uniref:Methyl-accepting transducer domain-containing protein n=1 Tax=Paenibacillus beijingensis TaxID=1126833 RepID=A0A0D5NF74_9BACL|nr:methyl-accepting chemotaxis protein [Paenibacillus beijingensis]AJY73573.1 hypothetical protein VN24_01680 [Paenibacillus beijingensis]